MFERNIYDNYHFFCEERFLLGDYEAFSTQNDIYIFIPFDGVRIKERMDMANTLKNNGEEAICELVFTINGREKALIDGVEGYLFKAPRLGNRTTHATIGYKLAIFHQSGLQTELGVRSKQTNYYDQWNRLWERRLAQLESWYQHILGQGPQTEVDDLFIITFPYYLGLCENAIQYVIDSRMDNPLSNMELPTICHGQFTNRTWVTLPGNMEANIKLPIDFIIDHPSRDLAEWIRYSSLKENYDFSEIHQFIEDYSYEKPLSTYTWQLIYGRLLFPVHYFSVIEQYYGNQLIDRSKELADRFMNIIHGESRNEILLRNILELSQLKSPYHSIPKIEWLS